MVKIRLVHIALVVSLAVGITACTLTIGGNKAETPSGGSADGQIAAAADAGPMSEIRKGMRKKQVVDILGLPTLRTPVGDVLMPSAFQPEMWSYRGLGRIYFDGVSPTTMEDPKVVNVEADPSERAEAPPPPKAYGTDD